MSPTRRERRVLLVRLRSPVLVGSAPSALPGRSPLQTALDARRARHAMLAPVVCAVRVLRARSPTPLPCHAWRALLDSQGLTARVRRAVAALSPTTI